MREFKFLSEKAEFTLRTDRRSHPPYGIAGGSPGGPSANTWLHAGKENALATMPMQSFSARRGDVVRLVSAGGGYGSPCQRDPEAVLDDVLEARVSVDSARELYRVAIDLESGTIDADETRLLRHHQARE